MPVPKSIDLGIEMTRPDGTKYNLKWASFNLGASSQWDYGDYYAWGETVPYSTSYKWYNVDSGKLTRYCPENKTDYWDGTGTPDNKTTFSDYDYEDDAARAILGGKWRIPTDSEWTELLTQCTWTWTTLYGVNGRLVTATNGNSIFLPAAGYRNSTGFGSVVGGGGYYWSSSLDTNIPSCAWYVGFYSGDVGSSSSLGLRYSRALGFSVRPVWEE